jgi:catechol 2,3-dioxygenase-like lactoylglutathione lyase family enzyme
VVSVVDHIAIVVDNLEEAAQWYTEYCGGEVTHRQDTYYRLQLQNTCIALLLSSHKPNKPHVAVLVECIEDLPKDKGTHVEYVTDPWGNHLEYICYNTEECKEKFLSYRGTP